MSQLSSLRRKESKKVKLRYPRPGRGVPKSGRKRKYIKRNPVSRYENIRCNDELSLFKETVHISTTEFDNLFKIVQKKIEQNLDPWRNQIERYQEEKGRPKKLSSKALLFFYLEYISGSNYGSYSFRDIGQRYGLSKGTAWNYFNHVAWSVYEAMNESHPLEWPQQEEIESMRGLCAKFPNTVMYVDGSKQYIQRSIYKDKQNDQFDGRKKRHCFTYLVWVDVHGSVRRLEISPIGRMHDKTMLEQSDVYLHRNLFIREQQQVIADLGFIGCDSDWIVVPIKRNDRSDSAQEIRKDFNLHLRKSRYINETSIGYPKNIFRSFLGVWTASEAVFFPCLTFSFQLSNWLCSQRGEGLRSPNELLERMNEAEKLMWITNQL